MTTLSIENVAVLAALVLAFLGGFYVLTKKTLKPKPPPTTLRGPAPGGRRQKTAGGARPADDA